MASRFHFLSGDQGGRIPELDGLRALMIFLVAWFHIWQQSWLTPSWQLGPYSGNLDFLLRSGYLWVDGMILLSGFLLALPCTGENRNRPMDVRRFALRRFARIYPSYALNVLVFFLISRGSYASVRDAAVDLAAHLTFTHTLSLATYYGSPINGALWTVGVEVQFYVLFPFLMALYRKKPLLTAGAMCLAAWAFRQWAASLTDCGMAFNQLPAFLDVYAIGILGAEAWHAVRKGISASPDRKQGLFFTCSALVSVLFLLRIAREQAQGYYVEAIRLGQLQHRLPLALGLMVLMISLPHCVLPVRFLFANPVMRFLSALSFQYYMLHQRMAVMIKEARIIPSEFELPNQAFDFLWQMRYSLLCFFGALAVSALLTWGFEKPVARLLLGKRSGKQKNTASGAVSGA